MNPTVETKALAAEIKAVESDNPSGEFEAILSTTAQDRDGESIAAGAFDPLPKSIPIYYQHDWKEKALPIGRGEPFYEGDLLKIRGAFGSSVKAQEVRVAVNEGLVDSMSVGWVNGKKRGKSITSGDLFESSFTAVPVNPTAAVLASKSVEVKAGARNSATDADRLQQIHDLATQNGASCDEYAKSLRSGVKAIDGSYEDLQEDLLEAIVEASTAQLAALYPNADPGDYSWRVNIVGTFPDRVIYRLDYDSDDAWQATYTVDADGEEITLGTPEAVTVEQVVKPSSEAAPPAPAAVAPTAKAVGAAAEDPVDDAEDIAAMRATYELLASTT